MTKNIFISGGTSGIGKALVFKFAEKKYNIFFTYYSNIKVAKKISKELKILNINHKYIKMDLNNISSIRNAFKKYYKKFKYLNYLISNANQVPVRKKFLELKDKEIKKSINSFLVGNLIFIKNGLNLIIKNKQKKNLGVINISSYSSLTGGKNIHLYSSAKSALNTLNKALSIDLVNKKIKIKSVLPRYIDTKTFRKNNNIKNQNDLIKFMKKKKISKIKNSNQFANFIYDIINNQNKFKKKQIIIYE